jgi:prophage antirepressor-like protein
MGKIHRITIDLSKHPEVFKRILASASKESRSLSKQVLHEVLPTLQKGQKA